MPTYTVYSLAADDGVITSTSTSYTTARSATGTRSLDSGTGFQAGAGLGQAYDGTTYTCQEALLRFDTSAISDTEEVTEASLRYYLEGGNQVAYAVEARLRGFGTALDAGDYVSGNSLDNYVLAGSSSIAVNASSGNRTIGFAAGALSEVSKTGFTDLVLDTDRRRLGIAPTSGVIELRALIFADYGDTSFIPRLTVTTALPGPQTISPAGVAPGGGVGAVVVSGLQTLQPVGVPPGGGVGIPVLVLAREPLRVGPYRVVGVARTPQSSGPPLLAEIGQVPARGLTWTDELSRPGALQFSISSTAIPPAIAERLRDPFSLPIEFVVYKGDVPLKAGFVSGYPVQGRGVVSVYAKGLLGYFEGAFVVADYLPVNVDLFTIARTLMDTWQNGPSGSFGLNTSSITTCGVVGEGTYLRQEQPNVLAEVQRLGARDNGFDIDVDLRAFNDRRVRLYHPQQGSDLSERVILDRRAIGDAGVVVSVAQGDVATEAYVVSTSADQQVLTASAVDSAARAKFGRWAVVQSYQDVSVQTTLQAHANALLTPRTRLKLSVGPSFRARPGLEVTDFREGDTIGYAFDHGLGLVELDFRVASRTVQVPDNGGPEELSVVSV